MRLRRHTLLLMTAAAPPICALAWNMPAVSGASNCGGNNAARSYVHRAAITMGTFAADSADKRFSVKSANPAQLQELAHCGRADWGVCEGDIWITTKPLRLDENVGRSIVAVCSWPFTNVPRYMFRRAPTILAVATRQTPERLGKATP